MSIQINGSTPYVWQDLALRDTRVSKIIMPDLLIEILREDSLCPVERSGYLDGIVLNDGFYVVSSHHLCSDRTRRIDKPEVRQVSLSPERTHSWVFDEEVTRRFAERCSSVATVVWHLHPVMNESILRAMCFDEADVYTSVLREEIAEGHFDFLREKGVLPSLDVVINEVLSRKLSREDIFNTPGCMHLLVTCTIHANDKLSHLNGFKIHERSRIAEPIPVHNLESQSAETQNWYHGVEEQFNKAFQETCARWESIERSLPDHQLLIPALIPDGTFYI